MVLSSTAESTAFSCSMAAAAGHLFSALEHRSPPPASLPEGGVGAWEGSRSACPSKEQTRAGVGVEGHTGASHAPHPHLLPVAEPPCPSQ